MERTCINCEYFVRASSEADAYAWGRCVNPETAETDGQGQLKGVFQWADGCCLDFKPRPPAP
jgi:hypothetical protein